MLMIAPEVEEGLLYTTEVNLLRNSHIEERIVPPEKEENEKTVEQIVIDYSFIQGNSPSPHILSRKISKKIVELIMKDINKELSYNELKGEHGHVYDSIKGKTTVVEFITKKTIIKALKGIFTDKSSHAIMKMLEQFKFYPAIPDMKSYIPVNTTPFEGEFRNNIDVHTFTGENEILSPWHYPRYDHNLYFYTAFPLHEKKFCRNIQKKREKGEDIELTWEEKYKELACKYHAEITKDSVYDMQHHDLQHDLTTYIVEEPDIKQKLFTFSYRIYMFKNIRNIPLYIKDSKHVELNTNSHNLEEILKSLFSYADAFMRYVPHKTERKELATSFIPVNAVDVSNNVLVKEEIDSDNAFAPEWRMYKVKHRFKVENIQEQDFLTIIKVVKKLIKEIHSSE